MAHLTSTGSSEPPTYYSVVGKTLVNLVNYNMADKTHSVYRQM